MVNLCNISVTNARWCLCIVALTPSHNDIAFTTTLKLFYGFSFITEDLFLLTNQKHTNICWSYLCLCLILVQTKVKISPAGERSIMHMCHLWCCNSFPWSWRWHTLKPFPESASVRMTWFYLNSFSISDFQGAALTQVEFFCFQTQASAYWTCLVLNALKFDYYLLYSCHFSTQELCKKCSVDFTKEKKSR